jgi:hypothetical protein
MSGPMAGKVKTCLYKSDQFLEKRATLVSNGAWYGDMGGIL